MMKKYVITGGPCIGKTTVIDILKKRGYVTVEEASRLVIEEEKAKQSNVVPWMDLERFQGVVVSRQLVLEDAVDADLVFIDRGIVDSYGYCLNGGVAVPESVLLLGRDRYTGIFILEQLQDYRTDDSRVEDPARAKVIHQAVIDAYVHFGYAPIHIPVCSPEERVELILRYVEGV